MSIINRYRRATFLKGARRPSHFPPDVGAEVAFAGRSNVGKSSVLNVLTDIRRLARTSKSPGRTRELNFFSLDPDHRLVDLPGYGFARVPEAIKQQWEATLNHYLEDRRCLRGLVVITDIRRPLGDPDRQLVDWCLAAGLPVHLVLNKADKLGRGAAQAALLQATKRYTGAATAFTSQTFSALKRQGVEALAGQLDSWLWPVKSSDDTR